MNATYVLECLVSSEDDGRVRMMLPPFAGKLNGFTLLFESFVIKFCKHMPVHNVCQLMHPSDYYVFLKNTKNLTKKQQEKKQALEFENLNLKSFEAMRVRETFQQIYQAPYMQTFETLLQKWYHWVRKCSLLPMVRVANMVKRHWRGILEGLNSVIQAAKRKARWVWKETFQNDGLFA